MAKVFIGFIEAPNGIVVGYKVSNNGNVKDKTLALSSRFHIRNAPQVDATVLEANEGEDPGFFGQRVGTGNPVFDPVVLVATIPKLPSDAKRNKNRKSDAEQAIQDFPDATKYAVENVGDLGAV